ncbi:hypothetical protein LDENG_00261850 [Lucifuga dentata]|nr:hypothetical protein LDENG_00261850 [Lucifuga dentata]
MSTAVESTGFIMVIISWLITGAALANDYWKISTVAGSVITTQREFENLWHSCTENSAGIANCRDFETILGLQAYIQVCRALMIISLLFGLASIFVALLGLKCIRIGSATEQSKAKLAITGGILGLLSGLCCMLAVSWYAFRVVQDFNNPFTAGIKFELGSGLFLGWGGASLAILGGGLLCSACKRASPEGKKGGYYASQPQKIYTATAKSDPDSARAYV